MALGLSGQRLAAAAAATARPVGLSDNAWATVVVVAVLHGSSAAQREVWAEGSGAAGRLLAGGLSQHGQLGAHGGRAAHGSNLDGSRAPGS